MKLDLSTDKKIKKFYKYLPLYKSFLFRWVKFDVDSKDEKIDLIVKGLNIKNRRKRIEYVYDEACRMVDKYYKDNDVCNFVNGQCGAHRCRKLEFKNGCCRLCKYQSDSGCISKNLACKLYMCSYVINKYDVITVKDIKILKLLSMKNRFVVKSDYFSKREDVLKDLYAYTLCYSTIRIVFRLLRK